MKNSIKKIVSLASALIIMATAFVGCSSAPKSTPTPTAGTPAPTSAGSQLTGNITMSGSTALQPLLNLAVDPFKSAKSFSGSITINGGGSGQGLTDVAAGTVNVGNSDVTPEQAGKDGTGLVDHKVAVVAVGIAVSPDVSANLSSISTDDLKSVFTGKFTNWNQVAGWKGGSLPIAVFYRKAGSGTRTLFELYGIDAKLSDAQIGAFQNFTKKESSGDLESAIAGGKGAIGYETLPYCSKLTLLKVDNVAATYDNVYSGTYKIWGYEHMYTKGEATGATKAFIEYVTSSAFADKITSSGYGVMSKMTVSR